MRPPTHIQYRTRLLGLCSFRDDAPNPQETGGPRELEIRWGGEEVWDVKQVDGEGQGMEYEV